MKLPDFLKFTPFNEIRTQMGANQLGDFSLDLNWDDISLEEVAQLQDEGIEVELGDIIFLKDSTIVFKNRRVLLYIRDWKLNKSSPKFHIFHCSTLEEMTNSGKFKRYVVSTRTDGVFLVNFINSGTEVLEKKEENLDVCKNCLSSLNYNDYRENKDEAFRTFDLNEFFARFSCSPIRVTPLETEKTAPINVYAKDWNKISTKYKKSTQWKCEKCGSDCSGNKSKFLHCHHKNGMTYDNRPSNIEVLCILCHSKQPKHGHMKEFPHYKEYLKLKI